MHCCRALTSALVRLSCVTYSQYAALQCFYRERHPLAWNRFITKSIHAVLSVLNSLLCFELCYPFAYICPAVWCLGFRVLTFVYDQKVSNRFCDSGEGAKRVNSWTLHSSVFSRTKYRSLLLLLLLLSLLPTMTTVPTRLYNTDSMNQALTTIHLPAARRL